MGPLSPVRPSSTGRPVRRSRGRRRPMRPARRSRSAGARGQARRRGRPSGSVTVRVAPEAGRRTPSVDPAARPAGAARAATSSVRLDSPRAAARRAPASWAATVGQAGSRSVRCRSRQRRQADRPGTTSGPTTARSAPATDRQVRALPAPSRLGRRRGADGVLADEQRPAGTPRAAAGRRCAGVGRVPRRDCGRRGPVRRTAAVRGARPAGRGRRRAPAAAARWASSSKPSPASGVDDRPGERVRREPLPVRAPPSWCRWARSVGASGQDAGLASSSSSASTRSGAQAVGAGPARSARRRAGCRRAAPSRSASPGSRPARTTPTSGVRPIWTRRPVPPDPAQAGLDLRPGQRSCPAGAAVGGSAPPQRVRTGAGPRRRPQARRGDWRQGGHQGPCSLMTARRARLAGASLRSPDRVWAQALPRMRLRLVPQTGQVPLAMRRPFVSTTRPSASRFALHFTQ